MTTLYLTLDCEFAAPSAIHYKERSGLISLGMATSYAEKHGDAINMAGRITLYVEPQEAYARAHATRWLEDNVVCEGPPDGWDTRRDGPYGPSADEIKRRIFAYLDEVRAKVWADKVVIGASYGGYDWYYLCEAVGGLPSLQRNAPYVQPWFVELAALELPRVKAFEPPHHAMADAKTIALAWWLRREAQGAAR